jgi:hypothetical protein
MEKLWPTRKHMTLTIRTVSALLAQPWYHQTASGEKTSSKLWRYLMHDQFKILRAATTSRGKRCWVSASKWYDDLETAKSELDAVRRCVPVAKYRLIRYSVIESD